MAEDLRGITLLPHFHSFSGTTTLTEIQIPEPCTKVYVGSQTQNLYIVQNGGTDGGTVPTNKGFIVKFNYLPLNIGKGLEAVSSIFVACQGSPGEISVILQEE